MRSLMNAANSRSSAKQSAIRAKTRYRFIAAKRDEMKRCDESVISNGWVMDKTFLETHIEHLGSPLLLGNPVIQGKLPLLLKRQRKSRKCRKVLFLLTPPEASHARPGRGPPRPCQVRESPERSERVDIHGAYGTCTPNVIYRNQ